MTSRRYTLRGRGAILAVLFCAAGAHAHVVQPKTLRGLVDEADLVLSARIVASGERVGFATERGTETRPVVEALVSEVLKGSFEARRVRFAQHGHGVVTFTPGDETLVFLLDIARSRELDELGHGGGLEWVSLQEHGDAYPLRDGTRESTIAAVRAYVAAQGQGEASLPALRGATLALLTSGDTDLAASALRDLVLAGDVPWITREDLPALSPLLDDPAVSMGVRSALLVELERRGLVAGDPVRLRWLAGALPARDRITAIRASAASGGAPVRARLAALLADPDAGVAAAAAAALGGGRFAAAVAPLAAALSSESAQVRHASIRSLGQIETAEALQALREAAESHPDAGTRRRARAELDKRAR